MKPLLKELYFQLRWALPIWLLSLVTGWWPHNRVTIGIRGFLHRPFFRKCGQNLQMANGVQLFNTHEMEIGHNVFIASSAWLNGLGGLIIEDEVVIGPYVVISSLTHCYRDGSFRFGGACAAPVRIGRGSWLAAHVSVAHGVTIGSGCLVAANAVVTKDVPPGSMVGGVPARVIKKCEEQAPMIMSRSDFGTST